MGIDLTPEEPSNVVAIGPTAQRDLEIQLAESAKKFACLGVHKRIVVCSEKRTVVCEVCGFTIDPFEYLEAWAKEGDRRMQGLESIAVRVKIAHAEHDDLLRKIANLRARLKRAGEPQPSGERNRYNVARWNPKSADAIALLKEADERAS